MIVTLDKIKDGQSFVIVKINDLNYKNGLCKYGLYEGQKLKCLIKINNGSVVILVKQREIALSHKICKKIDIDVVQ